MAKHKVIDFKKYLGVTVFSIGLIFLLYSVYELPVIKNKYPRLDRFVQSIHYWNLAHKYPPSSVMGQRFNAMSYALRHNSTDYNFSTGYVPGLGGK